MAYRATVITTNANTDTVGDGGGVAVVVVDDGGMVVIAAAAPPPPLRAAAAVVAVNPIFNDFYFCCLFHLPPS